MISIEVVSDEENWSKKIKKVEIFLNLYVNLFQGNISS